MKQVPVELTGKESVWRFWCEPESGGKGATFEVDRKVWGQASGEDGEVKGQASVEIRNVGDKLWKLTSKK